MGRRSRQSQHPGEADQAQACAAHGGRSRPAHCAWCDESGTCGDRDGGDGTRADGSNLCSGGSRRAAPTESGELTVRVTIDGAKATVTLDSAPQSTCWSLGVPDKTLLHAQNCAVFVESFANVEAL